MVEFFGVGFSHTHGGGGSGGSGGGMHTQIGGLLDVAIVRVKTLWTMRGDGISGGGVFFKRKGRKNSK